MNETTAPIPYAAPTRDDTSKEVLERPLPHTLDELRRYATGDRAFAPPHWVRLRATWDRALAERLLSAWQALAPLVERDHGADSRALAEAFSELELDPTDARVQAFAAEVLEADRAGSALPVVFALAAQGRGERFQRLFERADAPPPAHLLRLSGLRDHGGMPWSDAFARAMNDQLPTLGRDAAGWALRFIAELADQRARRFLQGLAATNESLRADVERALARGPSSDRAPEDEALPTSLEALELGAVDPRKPERQLAFLGRMAELDWPRARRLASSIATESWRLDEAVGALLNHASHQVMVEDFVARGLLPTPIAPPAGRPSARELLRAGGRVLRFDTSSSEGVIDHDALAYMLAGSAGLGDVDFLEELLPDDALVLRAWADGQRLTVELDTRRSVIDPYGLVGLVNVLLRQRERPERCLLAAEDKGMCDVVVGPEKELRQLVDAGLLWIRSGFRW